MELYNATKPILLEDCTAKTIVVEEKDVSWVRNSRSYRVRSGDTWYAIGNLGRSGQYTASEIYEMLSVGDEIDILYTERSTDVFPYKELLIVDARSSDFVYLEFKEEDWSTPKSLRIVLLILGAISEGGAIAITVVLINRERNLRKEERKKKQEESTVDTNTQT